MKFKSSIINTGLIAMISVVLFSACVNVSQKKPLSRYYHSVEINPVLNCDCSIRALHVDDQRIFFAGSNGKFGYLNSADNSIEYVGTIQHEGNLPEFRGLAHTRENDFILSAGTPALIYKVNSFGQRKLLYKQDEEGTFYDALAFWNGKEGIALGDPMHGCMSVLITRDAGETWDRQDCSELPEAIDGEAAFAASNSNISIHGDKTWLLSGGKSTRIYFSPDKGKNWKIAETPLINGKETTGGYSMDFYNEKTGVIIGGDYTQPHNNKANKAVTLDGGKNWGLIADESDPGYSSSIKFIPGTGGSELVAVGPNGVFYSKDRGENWVKFSDQEFHSIEFLNDFTAYASGDGGIYQLTFIEELSEE